MNLELLQGYKRFRISLLEGSAVSGLVAVFRIMVPIEVDVNVADNWLDAH